MIGVRRQAQIYLTMGLAGCRSVADIGPDSIIPAPGLEPTAPAIAR